LALATALSSTLNWALLRVVLRRHVGRLGGRRLVVETCKTLCAALFAVGTGWICLVAARSAFGYMSPASFLLRFVYVAAPLTMTGISYAILCRLLGVQAFARIISSARR
jgi:peptidoglycan biosynthesis protein MviN/MurJ (putative lipid II flippase)